MVGGGNCVDESTTGTVRNCVDEYCLEEDKTPSTTGHVDTPSTTGHIIAKTNIATMTDNLGTRSRS